MTPALLLDVVAALMLAVAALSAARLAATRPWRRGGAVIDTDVAHLLMAIAMAGMLAPGLRTLPDAAWEAVFGLLAAWFTVRVARDAQANGVRALAGGHCAPHLVHSCSMLYMFLAITTAVPVAKGMTAMGTPASSSMSLRYPTLALAFAFILVGYSIWDLDQLSGRRYSPAPARVSLAGIAAPAVPVPGVPALSAGAVQPGGADALPAADDEATRDGAVTGHVATGESSFLLSPAVTIGCRIAMGVAMAFMLFIAI